MKSPKTRETDGTVTYYDVRIPFDGGSLSGDVVLPEKHEQPLPCLIMMLPYRKDLHGDMWRARMRRYARYGYASVLVDLRGTGLSDGVPFPKMCRAEGEDGETVVAWAASQPWCDGRVGMWGSSAGGVTTLHTAARRPPSLVAIIPMNCPLNPVNDAFFHDGARVDLHQRVRWAGSTLARELVPPIVNPDSSSDLARWRNRAKADPDLIAFAQMNPQSASWPERTVDVSSIAVPTFVVGGWRDPFARSMIELHSRLEVPKRLMMGPWFHDGPYPGLDFDSLALEWWDTWFEGSKTPRRAPVIFATLGETIWRESPTWPPRSEPITWSTSDEGSLRPEGDLTYHPDPTSGTLSGIWGMPLTYGLPLDQHDDDLRAVRLITEPLQAPLHLVDAATVVCTIASDQTPARLVVRLASVDTAGRSTHIATGVTCPSFEDQIITVRLRPTSILIPAGHRIRVVISDADFPRLVPLPISTPFTVGDVAVQATQLHAQCAAASSLPLTHTPPLPAGLIWEVTREPLTDAVKVVIGSSSAAPRPTEHGHEYWEESICSARVERDDPAGAITNLTHHARLDLDSGTRADVNVIVTCTQEEMTANARVTLNDQVVIAREWRLPLAAEVPLEAFRSCKEAARENHDTLPLPPTPGSLGT